MLEWPAPKGPNEEKEYGVEWAPLLQTDTISTSTWNVPAPLVEMSNSIQGTDTIIWLSGGVVNQNYTLENTIFTSGGRKYDRSVRLRVRAL